MKPINNWSNIQESGDGQRLPAGGYVCKILNVENDPQKEYLKLEYDIVNGEFKDHFHDLEKRAKFWGGSFYRSYKQAAEGMFKTFINRILESNPGFAWEWDEHSLRNKNIGLVLGEEEYINNKNELKTRLYVAAVKNVDSILEEDYKIPELKRLKENSIQPVNSFTASNMGEVLPDEEIPF